MRSEPRRGPSASACRAASRRLVGSGLILTRKGKWDRLLPGTLGAVFLLACGSDVVIQADADGVGSVGSGGAASGSTAASASGGSGATSSGAMASVATSTGSGGGVACAGWDDPKCGPDGWCDVGADVCGGSGVCRARPQACDDDCPGVCACDGSVYCNSCMAQGQGVAVAQDAVCNDGDYAARLWIGGLDRIVVSKKDVTNTVCIVVYANWPADAQSAYLVSMPGQWGVVAVEYSMNPSDCDNIQSPGPGSLMSSSSATGSINWTLDPGKNYPCTLDVQMTVTLPMGQQVLSKTSIPVKDGCI